MACDGQLWANGAAVDANGLSRWRVGKTGVLADLGAFLEEWFAPGGCIRLHTSGSTGAPKEIMASKEAMWASALASCRAFGLKEGDSALLALPLRYIAGKMMVVRALAARLHLFVVEPSSAPFSGLDSEVDFAPLVPLQAAKTLQLPNGARLLSKVRTLLLGGGFLDASLEEALQAVPSRIFASYGMTETFSHIALRRVNGASQSDFYAPLPGVHVGLSADGCLNIRAPYLGIEKALSTHDLAEVLPDGRFRILGRKDAVINSGGIKIQAEDIERKLRAATGLELVLVPRSHPELGQCAALLWEGEPAQEPALIAACSSLPRFCRPRYTRRLACLPRTESGKIARQACVDLAAE